MKLTARHVLLCFASAIALCSADAQAVQHLVSPGTDWSSIVDRVQPGDEIILMPGAHQPVVLVDLHGEPGRPITIRGIDSSHVPVIEAKADGLVLHRPQHVIIQDIAITGARISGLTIDDGSTQVLPVGETPNVDRTRRWPAEVLVQRVSIRNTGPRGRRNAVQIIGVSKIDLRDCEITGWGGSAIEIVGSHTVNVEDCTMTGLPDHSQEQGVQIRARSELVLIRSCTFTNAGNGAVVLGGASKEHEFRPHLEQHERSGSIAEASRVRLTGSLIVGGGAAIILNHAVDCSIDHNTIINPTRCAVELRSDQEDQRIGGIEAIRFGTNLITWKPGALERLFIYAPGTLARSFRMNPNLWWSSETPEEREKLGTIPDHENTEQVLNINPALDDAFEPTEPAAMVFGRHAP